MSSRFLDDLDALLRHHSPGPLQGDAEQRIVSALSAVVMQATRAMVAELRGGAGPRGAAMIRYRPDWERSGGRGAAMIRYRPDWERAGGRNAAMIRYRPDWDRDPRSAAMIRYRPDWDRQPGADPAKAAAGMLEPVLKSLAERLGPAEAVKLVQASLANVGLSPGAGDTSKSGET